MISIDVSVRSAPYKIYLGENILPQLAQELKKIHPSSALIVTNTTVGPLYGEKVRKICNEEVRTEYLELPDGEAFKNWDSVFMVLTKLAEMGADRKSIVIALGGGVVGDLAGFAASIYMRGIKFIQVPTTLLAQVDSSVGGKTGMNMAAGKNMIGSFHQPSAVIADSSVLKTLPAREVSAGIGEIIKHGMLADADYFADLEANMESLMALDSEKTAEIVAGSCKIKSAVVAEDEKEAGRRACLNLGHTFGHAIEKLTGYGTWLHGEAVGCGLMLAANLSQKLGNLSEEDVERVRKLLERANLPVRIEGLSVDDAIKAMKGDKKSTGGVIHFVLLKKLGESYVSEVPEELVRKVLVEGGYVA